MAMEYQNLTEPEERKELIDYIANELECEKLDSYETDFLFDVVNFCGSTNSEFVVLTCNEDKKRLFLIRFISKVLDRDNLEILDIEFLRDLAKFIEEYGYI